MSTSVEYPDAPRNGSVRARVNTIKQAARDARRRKEEEAERLRRAELLRQEEARRQAELLKQAEEEKKKIGQCAAKSEPGEIEGYLKALDVAMEEATREKVKKGYKKKALFYHPDKCVPQRGTEEECTKNFQNVNKANEELEKCFES